MALLYRGESRWKILRHPVFWVKVIEIVLSFTVAPLVITYNDKGGVYKEHSDKSFNITVKYPFDYNNETAVYTDEDEPLTSFNFDPAIRVCAQLFVGVVIVAGLLAIAMLLISCAIHRDERVANKVSVAEVFISVVMVVLVAVITSLWLYNILELKKEVQGEIVNVITTLGPVRCKNCVEFLPDYSALFASVGLGYLSLVIWLLNTSLVYCDTINISDQVNATSSLIFTQGQELADKSQETNPVETTA